MTAFPTADHKRDGRLTIAFESGQISYSDLPVDLYNTGVNQILSAAAARGHAIRHFRMADLYSHEDVDYARMSILALETPGGVARPEGVRRVGATDRGSPADASESRHPDDDLTAYERLRVVEEASVPLAEIDLCFLRGDDVRDLQTTPNLDILQRAQDRLTLIERVEPTVSTCDKYEIFRRAPDLPRPATYPAETIDEAMEAIERLPNNEGFFVLKDRFGYGCGGQVHRLEFAAPDLRHLVDDFVREYGQIVVQEFCPEVRRGDIAVTFLDDDLIAPLRRVAGSDEWKTNASLGARELAYELTDQQERIAREARSAFPECRLCSIDMLESGRVLEINAFPGGAGLLAAYGISLGRLVMDRMEAELLG